MSAEWGTGWAGTTSLPAAMVDRILMFVRGPRFSSYVEALTLRTEALLVDTLSIRELFHLSTATGVRLDELGKILQRARGVGETDDQYRLLLQIQVLLILASQGTTPTLLECVLLYTGVESPEYAEGHPASISIGAVVPDASALAVLVELLRKAKVGGVRLVVQAQDADAMVMDYTPDPITGAGTTDYTPDPITGAGTTSYGVVI